MKEITIKFMAEKHPQAGGLAWFAFLDEIVKEAGIIKERHDIDSNDERKKIEITVNIDDESTLDEDGLWSLIVAGIDGLIELERL